MPRPKKAKQNIDTGPRIARCLIRVSDVGGRDDDANVARSGSEFISPEQQMETARVWCKAHNHVLDEEASYRLMDLNRSAFRLHWSKRAGLVQHIKDAQGGEFHTLIVYKISRLARNTLEGLEVWKIFEDAGVDIVSPTDNIDTSTSSGKMLRTMLLGFAQMQAEDMSQYSQDMHRLRAKKGKAAPSVPTWIQKDENGDYAINEAEAAPLRRIVELRLQMKTLTDIARTLNEEKLFRGAKANHFTGEGPRVRKWSHHWLTKMMQDCARFAGTATYYIGDDVYTIPNAYPAIITQEEYNAFDAINKALRPVLAATDQRLVSPKRPRGAAIQTPYLLSSLCYCGVCGGRIITHTGGQAKDRAYRCNISRTDLSAHPNGKSFIVLAEGFEDAAARVVRFALSGRPAAPATSTASTASTAFTAFTASTVPPIPRTPPVQAGKKSAPTVEEAITSVREDMALLLDLLMTKQITRDLYQERFALLKAKLAELEARAAAAGSETGEQAETGKTLVEAEAARAAAHAAAEIGDWRTVFLHMIARVDVPVFLSHVTQVKAYKTIDPHPRRCARVTLHHRIELPTGEIVGPVFFAALYRTNYTKEKELFSETGEKLVLF